MKPRLRFTAASMLASALGIVSMGADAQIGGVGPDSATDTADSTTISVLSSPSSLFGSPSNLFGSPSSLLGPIDLGSSPPFSSFGRFLPGVGPNASGTMPSPRLPPSALDSTTSTFDAPFSLLGPLDLGANPPFSSFGRFLPGVGANASGTRPSPRLRTPGAAPSAAASAGGGVIWDSLCDPRDFTCDD